MRPTQWVKNLFVFAGLIFSQEFLNLQKFLTSTAAFGVFCLIASGIYIFNDIVDLPHDKIHPSKKNRPIPSGRLPIWLAGTVSVLLVCIGLVLSFKIDVKLGFVTGIYVILQILYTLILKKLVIVDILVVASGFLLRAAAGAVVLSVEISSWLLLCTSLLALFLVTAKRRQEVLINKVDNSVPTRPVLESYNISFLDELLAIEAGATLTAYSLYVFAPETAQKFGTPFLGLSLPFVIYGIFRYLYLVKVGGCGESPEKIVLSDAPFLINLLLWMLVIIIIIYF